MFLYNVGNKTFALEPHEMYMHDSLEKFEAPGFEDPESVNFNRMNHLIFDVTKSLIPEDEGEFLDNYGNNISSLNQTN